MKKILFTTVILLLFSSVKAQQIKIFNVDITKVDNVNTNWEWDNFVGTYVINFSELPFDGVYKFPGSKYIFFTNRGDYKNMPERYNTAYYSLKEKFGEPNTVYTSIKNYVHDTTDWSDIATPIFINKEVIEYYWYINTSSNTIRLILLWEEKGITLTTYHFNKMSPEDIKFDAMKLKLNRSMEFGAREKSKTGASEIKQKKEDKLPDEKKYKEEINKLSGKLVPIVVGVGLYITPTGEEIKGVKVEYFNNSDKEIKQFSGQLLIEKFNPILFNHDDISILPRKSYEVIYSSEIIYADFIRRNMPSSQVNFVYKYLIIQNLSIKFMDGEILNQDYLWNKYMKKAQ